MYANKITALLLVAAALLHDAGAQEAPKPAAVVTATPLTIGPMAEQARQKRLADEASKNATPPPISGMPGGMTMVPPLKPLAAADKEASDSKEAKKKAEPAPPPPEFKPTLLGVFRKGRNRMVELAEANGSAHFEAGQITPSGWTVLSIAARYVELGKVDAKSGATRKIRLQVNDI